MCRFVFQNVEIWLCMDFSSKCVGCGWNGLECDGLDGMEIEGD